MNAGKLRFAVTIQVPGTGPLDDFGQGDPDGWVDLVTVRADVQAVSGRQALAAERLQVLASHAVTIRYPGFDLTPATHRLTWNGKILNPTWIHDVDNRHRELEIFATEQVNRP